ncbi:PLP-dependent aspartate aminotransferase family protein [Pusillimonas sp. ANT_WB101]|uniref:trans-sulfuration enzyme family protein n=1 Tax=Pusillimonas sp. ANT_WB101 TaxID=2597356 RepID=UPI0011EFDB7B|nr:PLP-dependent aspartate aminotransferase family protein [Pusillimonas sp. ANT_WB101]KAA0910389.1 PLP-dependent transferase [Pusillimonas sp. ANT_WB101]
MKDAASSPSKPNTPAWHEETTVLHGDAAILEGSSVVPPIYYSATYRAESAEAFSEMATTPRHHAFYSRYGNPVHEHVETILAQLEGTETALLMGSGMGAISTTILALVSKGDHVIAQQRHYMSTSKLFEEILPRFGVDFTTVDQTDPQAFAAAIRPNTRLIMLETPVNPTLSITDLDAVAAIAKKHNIITVADNTFANSLNQKPHAHGVDVVVHSATKYFGGHHDVTAGAVCCSNALAEKIWSMHTTLGSVLSPMDGWLLLRGLRTLSLRMERINANALAVAQWLEQQPGIERVLYPGLESHPQHTLACRQMKGFGAVIAFSVKGDFEATSRFVSSLKLATQAVSLGGVETLVVHTAAMWAGTMTGAQMETAGIESNTVRMSVGVEHIDDLKADLDAGLSAL